MTRSENIIFTIFKMNAIFAHCHWQMASMLMQWVVPKANDVDALSLNDFKPFMCVEEIFAGFFAGFGFVALVYLVPLSRVPNPRKREIGKDSKRSAVWVPGSPVPRASNLARCCSTLRRHSSVTSSSYSVPSPYGRVAPGDSPHCSIAVFALLFQPMMNQWVKIWRILGQIHASEKSLTYIFRKFHVCD